MVGLITNGFFSPAVEVPLSVPVCSPEVTSNRIGLRSTFIRESMPIVVNSMSVQKIPRVRGSIPVQRIPRIVKTFPEPNNI